MQLFKKCKIYVRIRRKVIAKGLTRMHLLHFVTHSLPSSDLFLQNVTISLLFLVILSMRLIIYNNIVVTDVFYMVKAVFFSYFLYQNIRRRR